MELTLMPTTGQTLFSNNYMSAAERTMHVSRNLLALACTAVLITPEAAAAPFNSATLRRIIDGREVFIDRRQATVNETADRGQELSTGLSLIHI